MRLWIQHLLEDEIVDSKSTGFVCNLAVIIKTTFFLVNYTPSGGAKILV